MREILRQHSFSIAFLGVLFAYFFLFMGDDGEIRQLSGYTMGTSYQVQIAESPDGLDEAALAMEIDALLDEMDGGIFSTYVSESELSRFNRQPVDVPFIASAPLMEVMALARDISRLTDGAFDVTVGPLVNLWGFGPTPGVPEKVPSAEAVAEAASHVGYELLRIDTQRSELTRTADVTVDLSAIAKGYAVDRLATLLENHGIGSYFVEIGGELKIAGLKPGGESWIPAIEAPQDGVPSVYTIFYSKGETIAVAGSGDYRNYFQQDGVRYSHEIDPRTGYPVNHTLAAAYVIDASAARADALATALMILGTEAGQALAEREQQAIYLIYKEGDGFADYASEQFRQYLTLN